MGDTGFLDDNQGKDPVKPGKVPDPLTRDDLLCISSQVIRTLHKCVSISRFKEQTDDAKLSYVRTLIAAVKAYEAILKTAEIEEMKIEIADIKQTIGEEHGRNRRA